MKLSENAKKLLTQLPGFVYKPCQLEHTRKCFEDGLISMREYVLVVQYITEQQMSVEDQESFRAMCDKISKGGI
ncbi:MAG TPA: hypothetical protein DHN29_24125 [Cytophagales bacterium]|nr:hypothetical protein [Cytophagales bacterium]